MINLLIVLSVFFSAAVSLNSPIFAQTIQNRIEVNTNTGGNTINGQNSASIETGNTSTRVQIDNQTDSADQSQTDTQIQIQVQGQTPEIVTGSFGDQTIELTHQNGQAILKTTDSSGNVIEQIIEPSESVNIQIQNDDIKIQPAGEDFVLFHKDSQAYSRFPLILDSAGQSLRVLIQDRQLPLNILPQVIQKTLEDQSLLDDAQNQLRLELFQDSLVYTASGTSNQKLFKLFPVTVSRTLHFSSDSGRLLQTQHASFFHRLLDVLSD